MVLQFDNFIQNVIFICCNTCCLHVSSTAYATLIFLLALDLISDALTRINYYVTIIMLQRHYLHGETVSRDEALAINLNLCGSISRDRELTRLI